MKLPIILSVMIAALAIPGTFASQEGAEPAAADAAPVADAAAAPEAAPPADATATAAAHHEEHKAPAKKRAKRKHHSAGHHHRHAHHHGRYPDGSGGHVPNKWDAPYDYIDKSDSSSSGCSGDTTPADHGKQLPHGEPGHPGPHVPAGM